MPRNTLRTELVELLRQSHKTRLPRTRGTARKGRLPNMTSIHLRPPEVAARIEKLSADLHMDIFFCDPHSPGNEARTKTPMGSFANSCPRGWT